MNDQAILVKTALEAKSVLQDPEQRGLPGLMALTSLKRIVRKLETMPPELSALTPERLAEYREANLIAAAERAMQQVKDETLPAEKRLKQLDYVAHNMNKADCGWQLFGLSERDAIELQFTLMCARVKEGPDEYCIHHYHNDTLGFLSKLHGNDTLDDARYDDYKGRANALSEDAVKNYRDNKFTSGAALVQTLADARDLTPQEMMEQAEQARMMLAQSGRRDAQTQSMMRDLVMLRGNAEKTSFQVRYDDIVANESGLEAADKLDKLLEDLDRAGYTYADIGLEEKDFRTKQVTFSHDGITAALAELEQHSDMPAAEKFDAVQRLHHESHWRDYSLIGRDTKTLENLYTDLLKQKLRCDFDAVFETGKPAQEKCWAYEDLAHTLQAAKLGWPDLGANFTDAAVAAKVSPLYLEMAQDAAAQYLADKKDMHLVDIESGLRKAGLDIAALPQIDALRSAVRANGDCMPSPGVI